jgi:hypothetical protein
LRTTMSLPAASDVIELAGIGAAIHLDMAMARREIWRESLNCMFAVVGGVVIWSVAGGLLLWMFGGSGSGDDRVFDMSK